jgi:hypothetical protein
MTDPFQNHETALTSPARNGFSVTPNDSADLFTTCRGIFVGVGGDISLVLAEESSPVLFKNIPDGSVIPLAVKKVESTLTTATDLVGLY